MGPFNPSRYWYSLWGTHTFACGWAFGKSPEAARDDALIRIHRWSPGQRRGTLTLQRHTETPAYFDFQVEISSSARAVTHRFKIGHLVTVGPAFKMGPVPGQGRLEADAITGRTFIVCDLYAPYGRETQGGYYLGRPGDDCWEVMVCESRVEAAPRD